MIFTKNKHCSQHKEISKFFINSMAYQDFAQKFFEADRKTMCSMRPLKEKCEVFCLIRLPGCSHH